MVSLAPFALALALAASASSAPTPTPSSPGGATLRWNEKGQGVYGFVVLRSEERGGPFVRINGSLVKTKSPQGAVAREYVYVDRDVRPGRTYYYALTAILESGTKQRIPGVQKKTVAEPGSETARETPAPRPPGRP